MNGISKIIRSAIALPACAVILTSQSAWATCLITKDDGTQWTAPRDCLAYFDSSHYCRSNIGDAVCQTHLGLKVPNFNGAHDVVIAPHRGLNSFTVLREIAQGEVAEYGTLDTDDVPQNSYSSAHNAAEAGFKTVELDVVLARDDDFQLLSYGTVIPTHYFDYKNFSDYGGGVSDNPGAGIGFVNNTEWGIPLTSGLTMRGNWTSHVNPDVTADGVITFKDFIRTLHQNHLGVVVQVDPKQITSLQKTVVRGDGTTYQQCVWFCNGQYDKAFQKEEYLEVMKKVLDDLKELRLEHVVVIKVAQTLTPDGFDAMWNELVSHGAGKVMWAPSPAVTSNNFTQQQVLDWLHTWGTGSPWGPYNLISFIDTGLKSNWAGNPFMRDSVSYSDFTDYAKRVFNRRVSLWMTDPSSRYGSKPRFFAGNSYFGNPTADNILGDWFYNFNRFQYSKQAMFTTDRPDVFAQFRYALSQ